MFKKSNMQAIVCIILILGGAIMAYGFKNDKCKVEVVEQKNFAVIEGTESITASDGKTININYPTGFTPDNCVPISCGIKYSEKGFNYVGLYNDSIDLLLNGAKRTLTLSEDYIKLRIENPMTDEKKFQYKIVLMKTESEG